VARCVGDRPKIRDRLEVKGRIFMKDPIRLGPNSTGAEFAAVVRTLPEAKQQMIEAAVDRLLKERDE
jgi:hypothetical protein